MSIDSLLSKWNKEMGGEVFTKGLPRYAYTRVPFTSPRLNYMTFGGLPIGKLVEFSGENGGGKTTTALDVIANYQQMPDARSVLYCDCENTLDTEWAEKLGVDVDSIYIFKPTSQSAEDIFQKIIEAIETDEIGIVVLDSIGVLVTQQELGKEMTEKTYGGVSAPLTLFSKKIEMLCQKHHTLFIGINQVRENLNSPYGGTTTPGGKGWKHNCAVRLQFRKGEYIDDKGNKVSRGVENPAGNIVYVAQEKNKTCPSTRKTGFYTLRYLEGIDYIADLIEVAIKYDIVQKSGAWFTLVDTDTGELMYDGKIQGQSNLKAFLADDSNISILQSIESLIENKVEKI